MATYSVMHDAELAIVLETVGVVSREIASIEVSEGHDALDFGLALVEHCRARVAGEKAKVPSSTVDALLERNRELRQQLKEAIEHNDRLQGRVERFADLLEIYRELVDSGACKDQGRVNAALFGFNDAEARLTAEDVVYLEGRRTSPAPQAGSSASAAAAGQLD